MPLIPLVDGSLGRFKYTPLSDPASVPLQGQNDDQRELRQSGLASTASGLASITSGLTSATPGRASIASAEANKIIGVSKALSQSPMPRVSGPTYYVPHASEVSLLSKVTPCILCPGPWTLNLRPSTLDPVP